MHNIEELIEQKLVEEAESFPLHRFLTSSGTINRNKIKQIHPDFQQEALNYIFIARALKVHGAFYGYRKVKFSSMKQMVEIYCPDHDGFFKQQAQSHLAGHGCKLCAHRVVTRHTEHGDFTVPATYHNFYIDGDYIVWYNTQSKLRIKL